MGKLQNSSPIEPSEPFQGDFVFTILVQPKKDGSHRLILNLKSLDEFVTYYHLKMVTICAALQLM